MTREDALARGLELCKELPIQTVARQLFQNHPEHFSTVDNVRGLLRHRRGANGEKARRNRQEEPILSTIAEGLSKLHRQEKEREEPIQIGQCKCLVMSDLHIPYHRHDCISLALETGKAAGIDTILLNGDVIDFYGISRFNKDPKRMPIESEIDIVKAFLSLLKDEFPGVRIIYKFGNHERRLKTYLQTQADALTGLRCLALEQLLELDELGIEYLKMERCLLGKLTVLHGDELPHGMGMPVNPARGVFLRAKDSTLVGHHHQVSEHSEGTISGKSIACWSTGCLCDLSPDYLYYGGLKWKHGFAIVEVDDDGERFTVRNHSIIDGKVH